MKAFPAGSGPMDRTTYMFTYVDPQPGSPALEELLEDFWELMPDYQVRFFLRVCRYMYIFTYSYTHFIKIVIIKTHRFLFILGSLSRQSRDSSNCVRNFPYISRQVTRHCQYIYVYIISSTWFRFLDEECSLCSPLPAAFNRVLQVIFDFFFSFV